MAVGTRMPESICNRGCLHMGISMVKDLTRRRRMVCRVKIKAFRTRIPTYDMH